MIRRSMVAVAALLCLVLGAGASAAAPEGPRLAFVRFSIKPTALELLASDESGLQLQRIGGGSMRVRPLPFPLDAPSWSPDGNMIAFTAWPARISRNRLATKIFAVGSDGSGLRAVPGTSDGVGPVFAPDGHTIAFARLRERTHKTHGGEERTVYRSETTWLADLNGGASRRITPWHNRLNTVPTSFSPDGGVLALARTAGRRHPELLAMRLDGSGSMVLASNATDGVYSPDGSQIAFLRVRGSGTETTTDLFSMRADGSEPRTLTATPGKIEVWPSWDPSGQRLAFAQLHGGEAGLLGFGDAIVEMNADGTCRRTILASRRLAFYGPTWQPGTGRGAGPLAC